MKRKDAITVYLTYKHGRCLTPLCRLTKCFRPPDFFFAVGNNLLAKLDFNLLEQTKGSTHIFGLSFNHFLSCV